jgi:chemotaxis protein methyltransferase CheR
MTPLEPALYGRFCDLIYAQSGLSFDVRKAYFVERRIEQRIEEVGATSALDYYHSLRYGDDQNEMQMLCEVLTVNETYFFREYQQLKIFAEHCLQETLQRKRACGDSHLHIWSAGCSTGEEPYTLAIILREMVEDFERWNVGVSATDISRGVLQTARTALYGERSLKDVPTAYRQQYFRDEGNKSRVVPLVTRMVKFTHASLLDDAGGRETGSQDFVFCRNVLIYLDDDARRRVVERIYNALRPGGYIFLGHSESVGRITSAFQLVRAADQLVYRK